MGKADNDSIRDKIEFLDLIYKFAEHLINFYNPSTKQNEENIFYCAM